MMTFEELFKQMSEEQIKEVEVEIGMSINDYLIGLKKDPLVEAIATYMLNKEFKED